MKLWKALAMLLLLGLLLIRAWYLERESQLAVTQSAETGPERKIISLAADTVQSVEITHDDVHFSCDRNGTQWTMSKPTGARCDAHRLKKVFSELAALRTRHTLTNVESGKLSSYDLAPPALSVTLRGDFGQEVLLFGAKHKLSGRRYLKKGDNPDVYLVDDRVFPILSGNRGTLRDPQPLLFSPASTTEVKVITPDGNRLEFSKRADGQWVVATVGESFVADTLLIEKALRRLGETKVRAFIEEPRFSLAIYGLQSPKAIIRLEPPIQGGATGSADEAKLLLCGEGVSTSAARLAGKVANVEDSEEAMPAPPPGSPEPPPSKEAYFVHPTDSKEIYEYASNPCSELAQEPLYYLHRDAFYNIGYDTTELRIQLGEAANSELTFRRADGRWRAEPQPAGRAESVPDVAESFEKASLHSTIEQLLQVITEARAVSYISSVRAPAAEGSLLAAGKPLVTVRAFVDGTEEVRAVFGEPVARSEEEAGGKDGEAAPNQSAAPRHAGVWRRADERQLQMVISEHTYRDIYEKLKPLLPSSLTR